ncbi:uncharacterized protein LOC122357091 isoform X2 [Puntigrus tetrazona]|uniref:uncharacterized protein LOC122357091 isoform X2 n=2 Tax=Puntigrus tetrazona TaxID=1606681 RepID=UPI001C89324B|nr:uncharacterized protein LOC122357091 isoform X2 [Puntigrus tetrazona]
MGNENSASELPEGAPDNVVLFPPEETHSDMVKEAAVHTDKVSALKENSATAENGSVHTDSVKAEPQVSADEEEKQRRQEEEDKDELEFPHDLLPSIDLDLSTELNLTWGTSLGFEQGSLDEMKNEAVALGGTANPLLAGLEHYMEASPPVVGLVKSCDGDQVSPDTSSLAQAHLSSESQQHVPSLNPLAAQMDYELQEAFRECEDEMAALGIPSHADRWTAGDLDRFFSVSYEKNQTEKAEVKNGSSSHKPAEFSEGCHGNDGAHTNDLTAGEEGVFSFRDYVLGRKQNDTCTVGAEDVKNIQDITENHSEEASQLSEAEQQTKSEVETKIDTAENIAGQQNKYTIWTGTQTTSEIDAAKETLTQDQSIEDICSLKNKLEDESSSQDEDRIDVIAQTTQRETGVIQETNPLNEYKCSAKAAQMNQNSDELKIEMHSQLISDLLACPSSHTDKHAGHTLHLEAKISIQPNIQKQVQSGTHQRVNGTIETNTKVGSSLDHQRQELGLPEQLSPEGKQLICSPPPEPEAHLSLDSPQGPEQNDKQDQTDGPCKSISELETIHHNHCATGEVRHEKNVSAVVIDFCQATSASEYEPIGKCDLETYPQEQKNGLPLGDESDAHAPLWENSHALSRVGAEEEEEESALEGASAESTASTLLQTTPTMPEMIESEGEKKRGDAFQSAAIILQAAERESAVLEADESLSSEETLSEFIAEKRQECTSVIFPDIKCSPVQKEEANEENCGNSKESKGKGGGLMIAFSPAGDKDTCTVGTEDKALVTYSSSGVLETCDWKVESSRSKERKGESEEEGKKASEGGAQNTAHASRVSQTEAATETCPSHRITASPTATQDQSDLIHPATADTAPFALTINRINDCDSISPSPPLSHINSTKTEAQREEEANLNPSPSASGAELPGSDRSLPPAVSSENECLTAQVNDQQVLSSSQIRTASCDTSIKTQQEKQEITSTSEDTSQSAELQINMRDIAKVEGSPKGMQSSFENQNDTTLKCQMTECASLPPLMVFESLHHPVKEASFNFKGFFSISKPALPLQTELTTGQRNNNLHGTEKEPTASEEEGKEEKNGKQREKVETMFKESKKSREMISTSQTQADTTVKLGENVNVNMSSCEDNGKGIDKTPDVSKGNPVSSLSAAGETTCVTEAKDVVKETLEATEVSEEKQENKEFLNVTPVIPDNRDESAFTEKNSVLLPDVYTQEGHNSSPAVDGEQAMTMSEGAEQRHTEFTLIAKEKPNEETKFGLPEPGDIELTCPGNSENLVNDSREHESKSEKYSCEVESKVKTNSMSPAAGPDIDSMYPCTQLDKKSNTEQTTTISECDDMLPYQTESQFRNEMMKNDAAGAGDTTVPFLPAAETIVPAQKDLSSTTTQSTNSDARDVSIIVLKAPGPMLSHCESVNDCDIVVAGPGKDCSVNCVCDSEIVKNITDKSNQQLDVNEEMLRSQNADAGLSPQEIAASSRNLLITADRLEQAGGSPLELKNPDIVGNAKMKSNEGNVGVGEVRKEKSEGHFNSAYENNICNAPSNATTENDLINNDMSEEFKHAKGGVDNKKRVKEAKEKSNAKNETSASQEEGKEQKNGKQRERKGQEGMRIREQKHNREETNSPETSCVGEILNYHPALTMQQSPNDKIKCDSLLTHLEENIVTLLTEEPVQHVSDSVKINDSISKGLSQVMGGEQNSEFVQENEEQNVKSIAEKDSKKITNTAQEQNEIAAKEKSDQTHGENHTLINLSKLSGEKTILDETIPSRKLQSSPMLDPGLTSEVIIEEALGCKRALTEKSHPVVDHTLPAVPAVVNASPERDHTQDPMGLSQPDLAFSQSRELQLQQNFMSAPEAMLSMSKSNVFENAETTNDANAEASEKQEKVVMYCSAEAPRSLNSTSESAALVGGYNKDVAVFNICPENEKKTIQTLYHKGGKFPVCGERTSSEIQTQSAPNLSVTASSASETLEVNRVIEATEAKEPATSASQESVSKHADCTESQVSVNGHENVCDQILHTKNSEFPVNHSSAFSVIPTLSHHETGLKTEEKCLDSVTPGDTGKTEISSDSMSDVAQMSTAKPSQIQQEKEFVFQSSDCQLSTTTSSASVLQKSIKEENEISVDQAPKDALEPNTPNSTPKSETAAWRMEQLNKHLSEQFPDGTQNTEEQNTQCSEQQLQHVRTCLDTANTISSMKEEDTISNYVQQREGIQEEISKQMVDKEKNTAIEMDYIEVFKGSSQSVIEESIFKENQSKLEQALCSPDQAIVNNSDQQIKKASNVTLYPETSVCLVSDPQDSQSPSVDNQHCSQQPTKSFIQNLRENASKTVEGSSGQSEIAHSSPGDTESLLTKKAIEKDDREAIKDKVSKVSTVADVLLGSGTGTEQVSQVTYSSDSQVLSAAFVPERSDAVNSSEGSDWLKALKEAASMSQIIPEHRDETACGSTENRPFETLRSPQTDLEFCTPSEEYFPPAPEESFLPAPEESFPPAPEDSFPPVPEESFLSAPEESFPPAPEESFPPAPEESFPPAPEENFPPAPEESFPPAPEDSFPPAPEESFPPAPEESFTPITKQPEEPPDYRSPLVEAAERSEPVPSPLSPLPQHDTAPSLPAHLLQDTVEFPTAPYPSGQSSP